jgi:hypothetical protein
MTYLLNRKKGKQWENVTVLPVEMMKDMKELKKIGVAIPKGTHEFQIEKRKKATTPGKVIGTIKIVLTESLL